MDALGVGRFNRFGKLPGHLQRLFQRQTTAAQPFAQRLALDQYEDDEVRSLIGVEAVDSRNVRVVERGEGLGLAFESGEALCVAR